MKKILSYFTAQPRKKQMCIDEVNTSSSLLQPGCEPHNIQPDLELEVLQVLITKCTVADSHESNWPICWDCFTDDEFVKKNNWLFFKEEKLGCSVSKIVGSLEVVKEIGIRMQESGLTLSCFLW